MRAVVVVGGSGGRKGRVRGKRGRRWGGSGERCRSGADLDGRGGCNSAAIEGPAAAGPAGMRIEEVSRSLAWWNLGCICQMVFVLLIWKRHRSITVEIWRAPHSTMRHIAHRIVSLDRLALAPLPTATSQLAETLKFTLWPPAYRNCRLASWKATSASIRHSHDGPWLGTDTCVGCTRLPSAGQWAFPPCLHGGLKMRTNAVCTGLSGPAAIGQRAAYLSGLVASPSAIDAGRRRGVSVCAPVRQH